MKTINKELTHANILIEKAKLLKAHAEIFQLAKDLESLVVSVNTFNLKEAHDAEYVNKRFSDLRLDSLIHWDE